MQLRVKTIHQSFKVKAFLFALNLNFQIRIGVYLGVYIGRKITPEPGPRGVFELHKLLTGRGNLN